MIPPSRPGDELESLTVTFIVPLTSGPRLGVFGTILISLWPQSHRLLSHKRKISPKTLFGEEDRQMRVVSGYQVDPGPFAARDGECLFCLNVHRAWPGLSCL